MLLGWLLQDDAADAGGDGNPGACPPNEAMTDIRNVELTTPLYQGWMPLQRGESSCPGL